MRNKVATVWGWGEKFEDVRANCEKYVSKRWKETTKECGIIIMTTERSEGITYYITAYTSDPQSVGDLAEGLFYVAFNEGSTKIRFVEIGLLNEMLSTTVKYRNTLEEVEKALGERERILVDKFMNNPKIKEVARGRKVMMIPQIYLLCELESKIANKITIEVIHEDDFAAMKDLLNSLTDTLIQRGFATRVVGYELGRNIEDYKLGDIDVWGDEVTVWLV
ncbi:MAG: hypothetical protein FGF53_03225 [Candidatus Brockarchaeota archaeon]|nr:hypothetical protein [Candidatus Brockarchaeota archaeon]MBO3808311.1 hypothetical protein [Candidatus Brockarchaeota archaeon]